MSHRTIEHMDGVSPNRLAVMLPDDVQGVWMSEGRLSREQRVELRALSKINIYDMGWRKNLSMIFGWNPGLGAAGFIAWTVPGPGPGVYVSHITPADLFTDRNITVMITIYHVLSIQTMYKKWPRQSLSSGESMPRLTHDVKSIRAICNTRLRSRVLHSLSALA